MPVYLSCGVFSSTPSLFSSATPRLTNHHHRVTVAATTITTMSTGFSFLEKRAYDPPSWASHLSPVPSHTISLGHLPTPIHKWNLPNLPPSTEVWLKRDDLSGMQLSGNKVRKLEFLLADAVTQGADCIVSIGGIQSNHCRATAVAAKYLNLDCYLILRTSKALVDKDPGLTGNLLVERLVGAHVELVSKEEYAKIGSVALTNLLKERLINEGRKPYVIPVGGSNSLGTWGYIEAIREIEQQLHSVADARGFDDIIVACGSGGTVAGLSVGSWLCDLKAKVHAFSVCDNPDYFFEYVQGLLDGLKAGVSARDIVNIQNAKGLGYAMNTEEELKFVKEIASATGVILDPVYSGGTVAGLSVGSWLCDLKAKVHAFSVCDNPDYFFEYVQGLLDGLKAGVSARDIVNIQNAKGLGYAMNTEEELKFVKEIASATGVILDPVYSGKAAFGLMKDIAENPVKWEGRRILFIHTGGLLGLFDKANQLTPVIGNWKQMDLHEDVPRQDGIGKMF